MRQQKTCMVTLKFSDLRSLWLFAQGISCTYLNIHRTKNTLVCECTEEELQIAQVKYNATIVNVLAESN